jgi:CrcB protein
MEPLAALPPLILVMSGGAVGTALRYLVGRWAMTTFGPGLPFGTWTVNIVGGLAMGLLVGILSRTNTGEPMRLLLGVGVLGGFTTFSSFSLETFSMIVRGDILLASAYAVSSVAGSIIALYAGVMLARAA